MPWTLKHLAIFFKNVIISSGMIHYTVIFLHETGPIQCIFSQYSGYWWPDALAPGYQYLQCSVHTHVFPAFYGLSQDEHTQWPLQQDGVEHWKTLGHFRSINTNMTNHHQNLQELIIQSVIYIEREREKEKELEREMFLASHFSDNSRCLSKWFTDVHRNLPGGW